MAKLIVLHETYLFTDVRDMVMNKVSKCAGWYIILYSELWTVPGDSYWEASTCNNSGINHTAVPLCLTVSPSREQKGKENTWFPPLQQSSLHLLSSELMQTE